VYTAPKPINGAAVMLRLITAVAVVVALMLCISIFFKVDKVNVSGTEKYTPWSVMEASGIKKGDQLLTLSKARVSGRIAAALPYVGSIRIEIQLPDTVNIEVTELDVVYAAQDRIGSWWLITAEGKIVEPLSNDQSNRYTQLQGIRLLEPAVGKQAVAEDPKEDTAVRGSDQLAAALTILQQLEKNGIFGEVDSVNVENPGALGLWYGTQYQVKLGDASRLEYKISCLKSAVEQMEDHRSGVLDISFTTWPDQLGYTPFNEE
jgi:cell division protein FtsQ